jgi:lipid-binding SYLF domain-containing protein
MRASRRRLLAGVLFAALASPAFWPGAASADTAAEIDAQVDQALQVLSGQQGAKTLSEAAKGILVFPDIVKAGVGIGGSYGQGALRVGGKTAGYYDSISASIGLQLGAQAFSYALFFMSDEALEHLQNTAGWEIGVGPNVTLIDSGLAANLSTTTLKSEIYAYVFDQGGLMGGLTIDGSKISEITPE